MRASRMWWVLWTASFCVGWSLPGCVPPIAPAEPAECEPLILVRDGAEELARVDGAPRYRILGMRVRNARGEPVRCVLSGPSVGERTTWTVQLEPTAENPTSALTMLQRRPFDVAVAGDAVIVCDGITFEAWLDADE